MESPMSEQASVVRIKVIDFSKGIKYAKRMKGVYDPGTKTWAVPANAPELGNLRAYGLERVQLSNETPTLDTTSDDLYDMGDEHSHL